MHRYLQAWKNTFSWNARARRKEYWMFYLFNFLITLSLLILERTTGLLTAGETVGPLSGLYTLATLVPSFTSLVRRLHDTDRSAWWFLVSFVPFVGIVVLLVLLALDGTPGENRFGADPKGRTMTWGGAAGDASSS